MALIFIFWSHQLAPALNTTLKPNIQLLVSFENQYWLTELEQMLGKHWALDPLLAPLSVAGNLFVSCYQNDFCQSTDGFWFLIINQTTSIFAHMQPESRQMFEFLLIILLMVLFYIHMYSFVWFQVFLPYRWFTSENLLHSTTGDYSSLAAALTCA